MREHRPGAYVVLVLLAAAMVYGGWKEVMEMAR